MAGQIWHDGKHQHLGYHADEQGAAKAFDVAARRLRGKQAHGGHASEGRPGSQGIWKLNFPTSAEEKHADKLELEATAPVKRKKQKGHARLGADDPDGPTSDYVGVSWHKKQMKWSAYIHFNGRKQSLGYFEAEEEAAHAVHSRAQLLRQQERARKDRESQGLPPGPHPVDIQSEERKAARAKVAAMVEKRQVAGKAASDYVGVGWDKETRRWKAQIRHMLKNQHLGLFDDEEVAARAFDKQARELRGVNAHGGRAGPSATRWRLNFPTKKELGKFGAASAVAVAAPKQSKSQAKSQTKSSLPAKKKTIGKGVAAKKKKATKAAATAALGDGAPATTKKKTTKPAAAAPNSFAGGSDGVGQRWAL